MGNCMEPLRDRRGERKREENREVNTCGKDRDSLVKDDNEIMMSNNNNNKSGGDSGVVRVKVVMTREELQWLMMQLSMSNGSQGATCNDKRSIEDVLGELEKQGRKRSSSFASTHHHHAWKPSLQSIPELLEMRI